MDVVLREYEELAARLRADREIPNELVGPATALCIELASERHGAPPALAASVKRVRWVLEDLVTAIEDPTSVFAAFAYARMVDLAAADSPQARKSTSQLLGELVGHAKRVVELLPEEGWHELPRRHVRFGGLCVIPVQGDHCGDVHELYDRGIDGDWRLVLLSQLAKAYGYKRARAHAGIPGPNQIAGAIARQLGASIDMDDSIEKCVSRARTRLRKQLGRRLAEGPCDESKLVAGSSVELKPILDPERLRTRYEALADEYERALGESAKTDAPASSTRSATAQ